MDRFPSLELVRNVAGAGLTKVRVYTTLLLSLTGSAVALEAIQLPSGQAIMPDGKSLVIAWAGDLWTSPIGGGEAVRLTAHPGNDDNPRVSRDGKVVFFNSERTGSKQVFQMPLKGGTPTQITFHSEGSTLEDLHPTEPLILVSGQRDHAGRRPTRLLEKALDPASDETVLFDATGTQGRYSADGQRILFVRSGAKTYRKGYKGSQAARVWIYDREAESFDEPVHDASGCRYPLWAPDGESFYYVTSRSGAFNIWQHQLSETGSKKDRQLTEHADDSVFAPTLSPDGQTLIYRQLFDLYSISTEEGAKPALIPLYHRTTLEHPTSEALNLKSTRDATVTPSGLEWAFAAGGEIWTMDTVLKEPHRLTDSPAMEADLHFSEKGKYLYYQKDNGIDVNYWRMSRIDSKDFWWTATDFTHDAVTKGPKNKWGFQLSPKEDLIAYIESPGTLWIAKPDGTEARKLIEGWTSPSYVWSPDGKHLAYSLQDENYNSDIYIVATDGESDPVNVSRHPDTDYQPRWSPDGKILAFVGRRHSASTDLFFVHLNRDGYFRSDRDARLESARKAMAKDPAYKKDGKEKKKKAAQPKEEEKKEEAKEKPKEKPAFVIDFDDLHKRIQRIPLSGTTPSQLHWMPDSKNLIFQSGGSIYKVSAKASARPSVMAKGSGSIVRYAAAEKMYLLSGGSPALLSKGRLTTYGFTIPFHRDREEYQRMGYRLAWRTLRDSFYDPLMNNRDWDAVREKYELAAAQAPSRTSYARVMALLLGELNASHMGFTPTPFPKEWRYNEAWRSATPHLGVRLDKTRRVSYVHPNGPADREKSRLHLGDLIVAVDGQALRSDLSLTQILNGRLDRDITLSVKGEGEKERDVTIRPISHGQARALAQTARLAERNEKVKEATDGKLGYLHVARMMWDEFEKFEHHIYERGAGKDGLIIDVRDNGGGFTADHLLTVLTQPLHAYTVGRNGAIGYPQDRTVYASWTKPIVVICNENSFSNAEIFAHAIKSLNRGKVVGMPTAGGVISTGSANILGLGRMRLPGRGWFLPGNGEDMELYGAMPHVLIDVLPGDLSGGNDPQLDRAIEVLKKEVAENQEKIAAPIYRSQR